MHSTRCSLPPSQRVARRAAPRFAGAARGGTTRLVSVAGCSSAAAAAATKTLLFSLLLLLLLSSLSLTLVAPSSVHAGAQPRDTTYDIDDSDTAVVVQPLELDVDNLDRLVTPDASFLIEFHAPWCSHCRHFEAIYRDIATVMARLDPSVTVARVNGARHRSLACRFGIPSFPSFYRVHGDDDDDTDDDERGERRSWRGLRRPRHRVFLFRGPRDADSLVRFARRQLSAEDEAKYAIELTGWRHPFSRTMRALFPVLWAGDVVIDRVRAAQLPTWVLVCAALVGLSGFAGLCVWGATKLISIPAHLLEPPPPPSSSSSSSSTQPQSSIRDGAAAEDDEEDEDDGTANAGRLKQE